MGWHLPTLRWFNRACTLRPHVYWIAIIVVLVCCQDIGYCSNQAGVCVILFVFTRDAT